MNPYAQAIREQIPTAEAAAAYGLKVDRQGWACCPFHRETKPSLRIYAGDRGFCCFGCGEKGSVIDLTMKLFGLTAMQAMHKLNLDFALNLPLDTKPDWRARNRIALEASKRRQAEQEQRRAEARAVAEWEAAFDRYLRLYRIMHFNDPYRPANRVDGVNGDLYAYALRELPAARYEAETAQDEMVDVLERGRTGRWRTRA